MTNQEVIKELTSYLSANKHFMGAVLSDECIAKSINALFAIDTMQKIVDGDIDTIMQILILKENEE